MDENPQNQDVENSTRLSENLGTTQTISNVNVGASSDKKSTGLFIAGVIFLLLEILFLSLFAMMAIKFFTATEAGEQVGGVIGAAIYMVYFGFPCVAFGIVASILNELSFKNATKLKVLKLIAMILSILLLIADIVFIMVFML